MCSFFVKKNDFDRQDPKVSLMNIRAALIITTLLSSCYLYSQTGSIEVNVYNMKSIKGYIHIALYDDSKKDRFPFEDAVTKTYVVKVKSKYCSYKISNLPKGEYAVVVYHDENSDGKCNRFLGIPTEDVGFSKNIRPKFSAPDFDDNKIILDKDLSIYIKVQ